MPDRICIARIPTSQATSGYAAFLADSNCKNSTHKKGMPGATDTKLGGHVHLFEEAFLVDVGVGGGILSVSYWSFGVWCS